MAEHRLAHLTDDDVIVEALPDEVQAFLEVRRHFRESLPPDSGGFEFLVADFEAWRPGETVTVAFLSGNANTHRQIAQATEAITNACNLNLDFGFNPATGTYRSWSEDDEDYQADIRVSFDQRGYFSLVGTDAVDPSTSLPHFRVGGRPHQRSLNLEGFDVHLPSGWQGTTRHEFLHALAFHHEHQNPRGPCADEFRWEDDLWYRPTQDQWGRFVQDEAGRRPGIYTYLAGYPNEWPKSKVDHNLRQMDDPRLTAGRFDPASIMLYRFPALFYRTENSPCAPTGDGLNLSEGDIEGLLKLYPHDQAEVDAFVAHTAELSTVIETTYPDEVQVESATAAGFASAAMKRIDRILQRK